MLWVALSLPMAFLALCSAWIGAFSCREMWRGVMSDNDRQMICGLLVMVPSLILATVLGSLAAKIAGF